MSDEDDFDFLDRDLDDESDSESHEKEDIMLDSFILTDIEREEELKFQRVLERALLKKNIQRKIAQ